MDPRDYNYSEDGDLQYIDSDDLEGMHIISDNQIADSSYDDYDRDDFADMYDSMSNVRDSGYFDGRVYG